jgi:hypothetical protein
MGKVAWWTIGPHPAKITAAAAADAAPPQVAAQVTARAVAFAPPNRPGAPGRDLTLGVGLVIRRFKVA